MAVANRVRTTPRVPLLLQSRHRGEERNGRFFSPTNQANQPFSAIPAEGRVSNGDRQGHSVHWERSLPSEWMIISADVRGEDASFCGIDRIAPYHHFALT